MKQIIGSENITLVQNSYGRCLGNGNLFETFYNNFLSVSIEVADKFKHTDFNQQHKLLRHGINLMIMYAAGNVAGRSGLQRIRETHSRVKLNIEPRFYSLWKSALLKSLPQHDRKFDKDVENAWSEVLDMGIEFIINGYQPAFMDVTNVT